MSARNTTFLIVAGVLLLTLSVPHAPAPPIDPGPPITLMEQMDNLEGLMRRLESQYGQDRSTWQDSIRELYEDTQRCYQKLERSVGEQYSLHP